MAFQCINGNIYKKPLESKIRKKLHKYWQKDTSIAKINNIEAKVVLNLLPGNMELKMAMFQTSLYQSLHKYASTTRFSQFFVRNKTYFSA